MSSRTTSGVSCNDSFSSDASIPDDESFSDVSLYFLDDEIPRRPTPAPTNDSDEGLLLIDDDDLDLHLNVSPQLLNYRPETSTSSLFSFLPYDEGRNQKDDVRITLPTFLVPENPRFFDDECASAPSSIKRFEWWCDETINGEESFIEVHNRELARNPRISKSAPEIPSLFKKREFGCGYCRSVGHPGWENHLRQKCRQLQKLAPCKICGAQGELNHTETYCPEKPPVLLPLAQPFLQNLEARRASRNFRFFSKYSALIDQLFEWRI